MKTLDDFSWKSKRVLLRVDLNSPIVKGKIELSERLKAHVKTIKELSKKNAKVVILAHQGRPGRSNFISLKQHAKLLNKFVKVKFVEDVIGKKAISAISRLKDGEVLLLDNVRRLKDEFKPSRSNKFVKTLAPLFDAYVNDAFSVAHRKQTSIVSFPKVLPAFAGRLMESEVSAVKKLKSFKKPAVFILGGEKPEENTMLIEKFGKRVDKILLCGIFGQYSHICLGKDFGAQNNYIKNVLGLKINKNLPKLLSKKVILPVDFAVRSKGKRKDLDLDEFPSKDEIFDIGPKTQKEFCKILKSAKTIFMKGTPGYSEEKQFANGTKVILKAIESSKAFSVIGGGHSSNAIHRLGINKNKISHISLSGGALLRYISGEKLAGLEVLK